MKQKGTNICQFITPLLTLVITSLLLHLITGTIRSGEFLTDLPFLMNIPSINNVVPLYHNLTCLE